MLIISLAAGAILAAAAGAAAWHPRPRAEAVDWSYKKKRVLVFVPGIGCANPGRLGILASNLVKVGEDFDCLVGSFVEEGALRRTDNATLASISRRCYVEYKVGSGFADFMQAVSPWLVRRSGYSHVLVLLEDVRLRDSFDLRQLLDLSEAYGLAVSSPRISKANLHPLLGLSKASPSKEILSVDVVEIFATLFRADAWECIFDLQDPTRMLQGHGPARILYKTCKMRHPDFKMGVLNFMDADHVGAKDKCKPIELYDDLRHWPGPKQRREALKRFAPDEYIDKGSVLNRTLVPLQ